MLYLNDEELNRILDKWYLSFKRETGSSPFDAELSWKIEKYLNRKRELLK